VGQVALQHASARFVQMIRDGPRASFGHVARRGSGIAPGCSRRIPSRSKPSRMDGTRCTCRRQTRSREAA